LKKLLTIFRLLVIGILLICTNFVSAQVTNPTADASIKAFNDAFLMTSGGRTYYKNKLGSTEHDGTWTLALDIFGMQDTYERTGSAAHKILVSDLCNGFLLFNPTPYNWDGWNDDLAWMGLAMARGYQITGTPALLAGAESSFNLAYDRGWNTVFNNGGIWEQQPDMTPAGGGINKEALSNNPNGNLACLLYQSTGKIAYLNKAIQIYNWSRSHIFNPDNGQVYANIDRNDLQNKSTALYNQGSFVDFAATLYQLTGNEIMLRDAQMAAGYVIKNMTTNGIISNDADYLDTWADTYARGVGHLCILNPQLWNTYYPFLKKNADAAWSNRRTDLNISWNAWNKPTPIDATSKTTKFVSTVALMQFTPTVQLIPSTIEAEDYNYRKGITVGSSTGGGKNIVSVEDGNWVEYIVNVPATGVYSISLILAGTSGGSVAIQQNNISLATLELPVNVDMQTYSTLNTSVKLTAGIQSIKIKAMKGGWTLDKWVAQKSSLVPSISINDAAAQQINTVTLNVGDKIMFDPQPSDGTWSWTGPDNLTSNERQLTISNIQQIRGGVYIARYTSPAGSVSMQEFTVSVTGCTPDPIVANVKINDGVMQQLSDVKAVAGSFITISPTSSDGTWSWTGPNGFVSNSREISFLSSTYYQAGAYTVTHTNAGGCKSTGIITITLSGSDPYSSPVEFYSNVNNGGWLQVSNALLSAGSTVVIGPHPNDPGAWKWTGPNNFASTSREITISNFNTAKVGHYLATYTNSAGGVSSGDFVLGMKGCSSNTVIPDILVNGVAWTNPTTVTIVSGGTVVITAPDITGTYSWNGPNGFTSNSRQLTFDKILSRKAGTYVLSSIDANSCITTYALNIVVTGDDYCGTPVIPYVNTDGVWKQQTAYSIKSGSSVSFGPQPNGGTWSWTGPNGFTSTSRDFTLNAITVAQAGIYRATYTNASGCESYMNFQITVDGVSALGDVTENSTFQLYPNPATENVTIKALPGNTQISIVDLSGRVLYKQKSSADGGDVNIYISELKAGIYFVKTGNDQHNKTVKLLKQ